MPYKYYGGVHPDYAKTAAKTPVRPIAPPKQVVLPMVQHIGAPDQPTVKVGDTVKVGQVIGRNDAPVSAPDTRDGLRHGRGRGAEAAYARRHGHVRRH